MIYLIYWQALSKNKQNGEYYRPDRSDHNKWYNYRCRLPSSPLEGLIVRIVCSSCYAIKNRFYFITKKNIEKKSRYKYWLGVLNSVSNCLTTICFYPSIPSVQKYKISIRENYNSYKKNISIYLITMNICKAINTIFLSTWLFS